MSDWIVEHLGWVITLLFIFFLVFAGGAVMYEREKTIQAYQLRMKLSREEAEAQYRIDRNKKNEVFPVPIIIPAAR